MESGAIGARLRARWFLILVAVIVASVVGLTGEYNIGHSGLTSKRKPLGVGNAQLLVDSRPSTLATISLNSDAQLLSARAPLFAEYATGTAIKQRIAAQAGVSFDSLSVQALTDQVAARTDSANPPAPSAPHLVTLSATAQSSVIKINTQAKRASVAERLAAATSQVLRQSVAALAAGEHLRSTKQRPVSRIVLRALGAPTAGTVFVGGSAKKSVAYGVLTFVVLIILILLLDNLLLGRARRRRIEAAERSAAPETAGTSAPTEAVDGAEPEDDVVGRAAKANR